MEENAVRVSMVMTPRIRLTSPGLWYCRVWGPSSDTGAFWMDGPKSLAFATPLDRLQAVAATNADAARIMGDAARDGLDILLREDDWDWPKVEGFEPPAACAP